MSANGRLKIQAFIGGNLLVSCFIADRAAVAEDFNAEKILKGMSNQEQVAYLAGVIEGLAIARYNKDAKSKDGMGCIYDWFYKDKQNMKVILTAFEKYPTYPPGSIIDVLVKKKCGE